MVSLTQMIDEQFRRGKNCWDNDQPEEALPYFYSCREFGSRQPIVSYWIAHCLLTLRRYDDAMAEIDSLLEIHPDNVGGMILRDQISAIKRNESKSGSAQGPQKIGFHVNNKFHYSILKPLFDLMGTDHQVCISMNEKQLVSFDPDVIVICDAQANNLREFMPGAIIINVTHGLTCGKNFALRGGMGADHICVASEFIADRIRSGSAYPADKFWITGYIDTDPLFQNELMPLPVNYNRTNKTVVYAPTYNPGLSSIPLMKDRMFELICGDRGDINILTKPHHMIVEKNREWLKWFRKCNAHENFHLIEDMSVSMSALLLAADVIISDSSSVIFQFLALDRPIVLINNLDKEKAGNHYDPQSLEWQWRDIGPDISDISDLASAVSHSLDHPGASAELRQKYRQTLFGSLTDGRAAMRIGEHIVALPRR